MTINTQRWPFVHDSTFVWRHPLSVPLPAAVSATATASASATAQVWQCCKGCYKFQRLQLSAVLTMVITNWLTCRSTGRGSVENAKANTSNSEIDKGFLQQTVTKDPSNVLQAIASVTSSVAVAAQAAGASATVVESAQVTASASVATATAGTKPLLNTLKTSVSSKQLPARITALSTMMIANPGQLFSGA